MKRIIKILTGILLFAVVYVLWPTSLSKKQWQQITEASQRFEVKQKEYAVFIDYKKPVFKKRLWLLDLKSKTVLLNCHVSHAKNSGFFWPRVYSNQVGSELSCTGTFKTMHHYESSYGKGVYKLGLRLEGLDVNNSNTFRRNIVFHSSFPFWSKGCFMTSQKNNKLIIDKLGTGSLVLVTP